MPTPWPFWKKTDEPSKKAQDVAENIKQQIRALPPWAAALGAFAVGSLSAAAAFSVYKRYGRRIKNSDWVTPRLINNKRWIKGVVTSVGDGDNFRFFHTPPLSGYCWPFKFRTIPSGRVDLKDETLHIRMAGVDAPEASHFGKPAQPYAAESLEWLRSMILGKKVYVQLLRKDQYSRIVSQVELPPRILPSLLFHGKNIPVEMLKAGWAVVYEQAGAEYGRAGKEGYQNFEAQAKVAKRGMWQHGTKLESPAAYKKRHAAAATLDGNVTSPSLLTRQKGKSWFSRLLGR